MKAAGESGCGLNERRLEALPRTKRHTDALDCLPPCTAARERAVPVGAAASPPSRGQWGLRGWVRRAQTTQHFERAESEQIRPRWQQTQSGRRFTDAAPIDGVTLQTRVEFAVAKRKEGRWNGKNRGLNQWL